MMDTHKKLSIPTDIVSGIHQAVVDLTEAITWGAASRQSTLTVNDVKEWFRNVQLTVKTRIAMGVIIRLSVVGSTELRIYQGILNEKGKCLVARQLIVDNLSDELKKEFGSYDMILFLTE